MASSNVSTLSILFPLAISRSILAALSTSKFSVRRTSQGRSGAGLTYQAIQAYWRVTTVLSRYGAEVRGRKDPVVLVIVTSA